MEIIKTDKRKKYDVGFKQHKKDIKYNNVYYHKTKGEILCPICNKKILNYCLKLHLTSKKCKEQKDKNNVIE
jgi:hypothetical protein